MAIQPQPARRVDSYLLRLSEPERADLEFICRLDGSQISDKLRELIEKEADRKRKSLK